MANVQNENLLRCAYSISFYKYAAETVIITSMKNSVKRKSLIFLHRGVYAVQEF